MKHRGNMNADPVKMKTEAGTPTSDVKVTKGMTKATTSPGASKRMKMQKTKMRKYC